MRRISSPERCVRRLASRKQGDFAWTSTTNSALSKVINGLATVTVLGGSVMPPEVTAAMAEAAQHFVELDDLQAKAGQRIAEWTHNEAAYVTCGAAAGIVLSTAACMAGTDPDKRARLPETDGMKNEVIVHQAGIVGYAQAIRHAGREAHPDRHGRGRDGRRVRGGHQRAHGRHLLLLQHLPHEGPGAARRGHRHRPPARHPADRGRRGPASTGREPVALHRDGRRSGDLQRRQGAVRPAKQRAGRRAARH